MNAPLIQKFNILKYTTKLLLHKPADITDFDGIDFDTEPSKDKYDLIFAFVFSMAEFCSLLQTIVGKAQLHPNGICLFAYPKKGNKQYPTYIGRDDFFAHVEVDDEGYVYNSPVKFNKMAAFNDVFTVVGLKHEEKRKRPSLISQSVADYVDRIPDIKAYLLNNQNVLALFEKLTPGYQRDWARYVYGVKNPATIEKHLLEMEEILKQGYKSLDLYRRRNK